MITKAGNVEKRGNIEKQNRLLRNLADMEVRVIEKQKHCENNYLIPKYKVKIMEPSREFRREMANALIHGIGILFGIASLPILSAIGIKTDNIPTIVGVAIYSFSFLLVFAFSTLYHSARDIDSKKTLRKLDHIAIYFLIAGTYTPFLLIYIQNVFGIILLSIQWSIVLFGIIFKVFFTGRFRVVSTLIYIAMGSLFLVGGKIFFVALPISVLVMILVGGGLFITGCIFYLDKKFYYHHAFWHLFVLSAAICHFVAVLLAVILQ